MPNYKKMYHHLFWSIKNTIERLKISLLEAEEIYLAEEKENIDFSKTIWLDKNAKNKKSPR